MKIEKPDMATELAIKDNTEAELTTVQIGMQLKQRFVLEELLAIGGMGNVYKARDLRKEEAKDLNSTVAIKVLGDEFRYHPEAFVALQREARRIQQLAHPNIVTVYDFDRDGDIVFMTMEYLHGLTLDEIIKNPEIKLSTQRVLEIAAATASALDLAHQHGIIHSDLKPSNIFITHSGEVKIIDFGIARSALSDDSFDAASLAAFTPAYASCEMLKGAPPDPRDDTYALACIIYELLSEQHPYQRLSACDASEQKLQPTPLKNISRHAWQQLSRGLALTAAERPISIAQFVADFDKPRSTWRQHVAVLIPSVLALVFAGLFLFELFRG